MITDSYHINPFYTQVLCTSAVRFVKEIGQQLLQAYFDGQLEAAFCSQDVEGYQWTGQLDLAKEMGSCHTRVRGVVHTIGGLLFFFRSRGLEIHTLSYTTPLIMLQASTCSFVSFLCKTPVIVAFFARRGMRCRTEISRWISISSCKPSRKLEGNAASPGSIPVRPVRPVRLATQLATLRPWRAPMQLVRWDLDEMGKGNCKKTWTVSCRIRQESEQLCEFFTRDHNPWIWMAKTCKNTMFLQKWNPEEWIDVEGTTHFTDVTKTLTPLH